MKKGILLFALLLLGIQAAAQAESTLLLRQPALSADRLAFVYAGDIWVAKRDGSDPRRLTADPAEENTPIFSPDGTMIAYRANYEGNSDVYVIPTQGGQPKRLTWHPGSDVPVAWAPDGSTVALVSPREREHGRSAQLYHASLEGGLPVKQMEARIYRGTYDADGRRLAYIPHTSGYNGLFGGSSGWKGYRGGTTPAINIMDLDEESVVTVPGPGATNFNPIWLDGRLYFLSDRDDKTFNLFRYDPSGQTLDRVSNERDWDIRAAGGHGETIVYEAGGRLKSLDLGSGEVEDIDIRISPDLPQLRTEWESADKHIQNLSFSTTGKRALVTARGEVFTVPVEHGSTRNLTDSPGTREYTALWSPDGKQVAYIVDSRDGQSLVVADQTGAETARRIELGPHFYQLLAWSAGDEPRIAYQDNHLGLHLVNVESGDREKIAENTRREGFDVAFSPDGRWLAYTLEQPNFHRRLMLYNVGDGEHTAVGNPFADAAAPAFGRDGKYLFFAASTNSGPLQVGLNMTSQERPYRAGLYALVLAADGKSPLHPRTGDENGDEEKEKENGDEDNGDNGKGDKDEKPPETTIDLDGLDERIVALPVAKRNYSRLGVADDGKLYYIDRVQPGVSDEPPGKNLQSRNKLVRFDFEERETQDVLEEVAGYTLSFDGKMLLIRKVDNSLVTAKVDKEIKAEKLDTSGVRMRIDPREEWAQIFDEVWRMEKEYFYADNMHGLDWEAVYDKYRPLVDHVGRREDLNDLLVQMIAELQVGHNRVGGGDVHEPDSVKTGLLGANLAIHDGRYRIEKIYTGEQWNPFLDAPLADPGNAAEEGEYILALNGRELTADDNIFARLKDQVGKQVTLKVGPEADGDDAREIVVEPVDSESELRLWAWIEENRRQVEEATDGRVGYIYLPNTASAGYTYFNRFFFSQLDKEALIIDERSNSGGQAANYITDVLSREHLSGWKDRDGLIYRTPAGAMHGPKVMLIDQDAGSGGDFLPYSFRELGLGPLIGTRTWGGLIGIAANPGLTDGGYLSVPFFRFFDTDNEWSVENEGVAPDIEVALDPIATNEGRDTQLERAIQVIKERLADYEPTVPDEAPPLPTELGQ
jgi:tricorn protease